MFGFDFVCSRIGKSLARYLSEPLRGFKPLATTDVGALRGSLHPGDVLLVEGNTRVSTAIKYLTQSTWSHAAMYVGDISEELDSEHKNYMLIEAAIKHGVHTIPLSYYEGFNTRICRPVGLTDQDRQRIVDFMLESIGMGYDLKNVIDLARYLIPTPPVPIRWRRRLLSLGSGDPTRAICSTLIAQAFQSVRYPILPIREPVEMTDVDGDRGRREVFHVRHSSLFTPRDFDVSPWFRIIKPTLERDFDYRQLAWADQIENV